MSISSVGSAAAAWFTATPTVASGPAAKDSAVQGHLFRPNDPLNGYLTDGDRSAVKAATGVDVRADGGILCPVSMSASDYGAVLSTVGQLAADRANGNSAALSMAGLAERLGQYHFQDGGVAAIDGSARDLRVDFRA